MAFSDFTMDDKESISEELSHDFKYIGNGTKDQENSIQEKPYKIEIVWPVMTVYALMHLGILYSVYLFFFRVKFLTAFFGLYIYFHFYTLVPMSLLLIYQMVHRNILGVPYGAINNSGSSQILQP